LNVQSCYRNIRVGNPATRYDAKAKERIVKEAYYLPRSFYGSDKEQLRWSGKVRGVSEVAREYNLSRGTLLSWMKKYLANGIDGLKRSPPNRKDFVNRRPDIEKLVLSVSADHPAWGCAPISRQLESMGTHVSHTTVQRILTEHGRRTRSKRIEKTLKGSDS
jgi:transposase-like protein